MRVRIVCTLITLGVLIAPAAASAYFPHVVAAGESLYSIAAADGLSVDQLAAANGLAPGSQLLAGSTVLIPPAGVATVAPVGSTVGSGTATVGGAVGDGDGDSDDVGLAEGAGISSSSAGGSGAYVVQPGDTLSAIAARAGVTVAGLAAANGIDPNAPLLSGTVLRVSGYGSASAGTVGTAATQPVGAAAEGASGGPPYPTPERVTSTEVGSIASANGVPAALADAIGWQESGFNNDLVSSADARGVMQILPGTWNWIQSSLNPGPPLAPASATDNVRGGVLLLRSLLNSTGGDAALAAAGYYQGLPSVRANGEYASTQQYVGNVMSLAQRFGGL
jgi:LysM repeat protein